jgi:hypothetical protein
VQCLLCAVVEEHLFGVSALLMVILTELLTILLSRYYLLQWGTSQSRQFFPNISILFLHNNLTVLFEG